MLAGGKKSTFSDEYKCLVIWARAIKKEVEKIWLSFNAMSGVKIINDKEYHNKSACKNF
jgi:hypothetical protein